MRCGCPECGSYMVQRERGLDSVCQCPACFFACRACMGTKEKPAEMTELKMQAQLRARIREWEEGGRSENAEI